MMKATHFRAEAEIKVFTNEFITLHADFTKRRMYILLILPDSIFFFEMFCFGTFWFLVSLVSENVLCTIFLQSAFYAVALHISDFSCPRGWEGGTPIVGEQKELSWFLNQMAYYKILPPDRILKILGQS